MDKSDRDRERGQGEPAKIARIIFEQWKQMRSFIDKRLMRNKKKTCWMEIYGCVTIHVAVATTFLNRGRVLSYRRTNIIHPICYVQIMNDEYIYIWFWHKIINTLDDWLISYSHWKANISRFANDFLWANKILGLCYKPQFEEQLHHEWPATMAPM